MVQLYSVAALSEPRVDVEGLLAAEEQAGLRDPYRRLTALNYTLAPGPADRAGRPYACRR